MAKIATKVFTSNGNWTAPAGVTRVVLYGWGGGGGGGGGTTTSPATSSYAKGGGGGGGAVASTVVVNVTPGSTYAVTIGNGGSAGVANSGSAGGSGGDTTFGSLALFRGAQGGQVHHSVAANSYRPAGGSSIAQAGVTDPSTTDANPSTGPGCGGRGGASATVPAADGNYNAVGNYSFGLKGTGGATAGSYNGGGGGGGGGAGPEGAGGNGGAGGDGDLVVPAGGVAGSSAAANSGAGGGGGGAGGFSGFDGGVGANGGAGGSGKLTIYWIE